MLDLKALIKGGSGLANSVLPLLRTASVDGSAVDLKGYKGAMFLLHCGTVTDGTHTVVLEESDTGAFSGEENAIADADLDGSEPAYTSSNEERVDVVFYRGTKRYVRVTIIASGSPSTGATIGAQVLRHHPQDYNAI